MPTDLSPRYEVLLKKLDTRRTMVDHKPNLRERAMMMTFWEQITPTFSEYGKIRVAYEETKAALDDANRRIAELERRQPYRAKTINDPEHVGGYDAA